MPVEVLNPRTYGPVGSCIYCGSTSDLRLEHILPNGLSLSGSASAKLPKSSCRDCAKITSRMERTVLRGPMWPARVYRDLKSYRNHKDAPKTYRLTVVRKSNKEEVAQLPVEDYPILLPFPIFPAPAFLNPNGYTSGICVTGLVTLSFGPRPEDVAKRLGVRELRLTRSLQPICFALMLAKIAYAFAAAEDKLRLIEGEATVLPAILGSTDDIGKWVGTLTEPFRSYDGQLHRILVTQDREKGLLMGEVQLFSDSQAPSYGVILGRLR